MDPSVLLTLMLATYGIPIAVVYFKYCASNTGSRSISSIITSQEPFFVTAAPPPRYNHLPIPNEILHCRMYAVDGRFHHRL
jgi:hypothetical protein